MDGRSDDQLITSCLEAKQTAADSFGLLYQRHAGGVLAFLRGMHPGDEHAARDSLQETFFRFYKALPAFEQGRPVRPWLFRIARNVSLDHKKKAAHRAEVPHEPGALGEMAPDARAEDPARAATRREEAGILREAVARLPQAERSVFLLKHDQGLTYQQVAEALSCSLRTAKYRMKAALERLGREAERLGVGAEA